MFDPQVGQFLPVDEDHSLCQMLDVVARGLAESRRCDEDAFGGTQADEASDEPVDIGATDQVAGGIALGLDIDAVKAEAVFIDDAVDTAVTRAAELGGGVLVLPP